MNTQTKTMNLGLLQSLAAVASVSLTSTVAEPPGNIELCLVLDDQTHAGDVADDEVDMRLIDQARGEGPMLSFDEVDFDLD